MQKIRNKSYVPRPYSSYLLKIDVCMIIPDAKNKKDAEKQAIESLIGQKFLMLSKVKEIIDYE